MKGNRWLPVAVIAVLMIVGVSVAFASFSPKKKKRGAPALIHKVKELPKEEKEKGEELPFVLGVLRGIDAENKTLSVYLPEKMREETFSYDTATSVKSFYDRELVMEGLAPGSILDLSIGEEGGRLRKVAVSKEAWDYRGVKNLEIEETGFGMKIGKKRYHYDAGLTVISGKERVNLSSVLPEKDILDIRGLDDKILSIHVVKGHGVLDFSGIDEFLGGNIEVGYDVFEEVKENMKYALREGFYKVLMEKGGLSVNKVVEIKRDRTVVLDVDELTVGLAKKSEVSFEVKPETARLYLDGKELSDRKKMKLAYGEYILRAVKDGYTEWEDIITIGQPTERIGLELAKIEKEEKITEEKDEEKEEENSEETSSEKEDSEGEARDDGLSEPSDHTLPTDEPQKEREGEASETTTKKTEVRTDSARRIYFRKPEGVTVTMDKTVIGVIPCETVKVTGEHKVTLEKDGFATEHYTIDISNDGEDAVFSFPELVK